MEAREALMATPPACDQAIEKLAGQAQRRRRKRPPASPSLSKVVRG